MLQNVNMPYTLTVRSRQGCSDAIGPVASFLQLLHKCHEIFRVLITTTCRLP